MSKLGSAQAKLTNNGYRLENRGAFEVNADPALIARASQFIGAWVLWDPNDDADGFLLVGDDWEELYAEFIAERGEWLEGGDKAAISC